MKHLKKLNELFESIENSISLWVQRNEHKLKEELIEDSDFAEGHVFQGILNILYDEWQKNSNLSYDKLIDWVSSTYGELPKFAMYLASYNYQVGNGGHSQYFDNGYASSRTKGFGSYDNIDLHNDFEEMFKELKMDEILEVGKKALQIIQSFTLDFDDDVEECSNCSGSGREECPECSGSGSKSCPACGGSGENDEGEKCDECGGNGDVDCDECGGECDIRCGECDGDGQVVVAENVPMIEGWDNLDNRWYEIDDKVVDQFNAYLRTLTLDGEKMEKLISLANSTQKYNL